MTNKTRQNLAEVARFFIRLGFTAFGGPAAHIAIMHDELVKRRRWLDEQHFLDLLGATNLIPGPNSTEMAIHLGFVRAGWAGLITAGACFILPAASIVLALAWIYVRFGATPAANWLLYGVKPVVIAVVVQALWGLGRKAVKGPLTAIVGLAVLLLYFLQFNELALLIAGGLVVMGIQNWRRVRSAGATRSILPILPGSGRFVAGLGQIRPEAGLYGRLAGIWAAGGPSLAAAAAAPVDLIVLFLTFLKVGAVLYGSGYVLLAFLRADLVTRLGWLTDQQLIDAIAIGQLTPGPVFTTATFIGYVLGGLPGAALATLGIFLPSFFLVAISNPLIPRLRNSPWAGSLLDGVNVASLGLMAAVTWQLGRASLVDAVTLGLALAAAVLLLRFKVNSTWLILGGAAVGWVVGSS